MDVPLPDFHANELIMDNLIHSLWNLNPKLTERETIIVAWSERFQRYTSSITSYRINVAIKKKY